MEQVTLGIDIGGTNTKFGLVDRQGKVLMEDSVPTAKTDIDKYLNYLYEAIEERRQGLNTQLLGVGIGAPNGNYYSGSVEYAPNLSWKGVVPFVEMFQKYYDLPMLLTNDANAAAVGEQMFGGAKGMNNFIMITLGTGLGSGFVVNGDLVYGHDGFAGELGHIQAKRTAGRHCNCGKQGCLETYASATGIRRTAHKMIAEMVDDSPLRDKSFNQLSAKEITELATKGDPIAQACFEYTAMFLGEKLADTVAHTSPEAIFFFGGLTNAGKWLMDPLRVHFEKNLLPIYRNKVKLLLSDLNGRNAAVLGASALVWKELEKQHA